MAKSKTKKVKKWNKKEIPFRSIIISFAFAMFIIYLIVVSVNTVIKINETQEKINTAQSKYEQIVNANKDTENLLKNANENDIIERIARERLGYVYPDEQVFIDISGS